MPASAHFPTVSGPVYAYQYPSGAPLPESRLLRSAVSMLLNMCCACIAENDPDLA